MNWIYIITIYIFAATSLYAAISDWQRFKIPNIVSLILLAAWPIHVFTAPTHSGWEDSLLVAILVLAGGFYAYSRKWVGAGDIKFLATSLLWVPPAQIADFILVVSISGGILCIGLLSWRMIQKNKALGVTFSPQTERIAQKSPYLQQYAPYGVAIACGCLFNACQLLVNSYQLG